jgi:septum formation protein
MRKIVLASSSPRRKQLLKQIGLDFIVDASFVDEVLNPRLHPRKQVAVLSLQKAEEVAKRYADALIIAADTMVAIDDQLLGKPKDVKEAKRMLQRLSGRSHVVVTGFTVWDTKTKRRVTKSSEARVFFKKLSQREIDAYVRQENVLDKAGSYGVQGVGAVLIERIEGDYFTAVGLPLQLLYRELRKFGVEVLE